MYACHSICVEVRRQVIGSGGLTQVVRLGSKHHYQISHIDGLLGDTVFTSFS